MLKLLKVDQVVKEKIKVDDYIPIKVVWKELEEYPEPIINWRTGEIDNSFFEIGLSEATGMIRSLTLVSLKEISYSPIQNCTNIKEEEGTPVFYIKDKKNDYVIDDFGMLKVQFYNGQLDIIFSDNNVKKRIISGRIYFYTDNDMNLCKISICSLTDQEKAQVEDTLNFTINGPA